MSIRQLLKSKREEILKIAARHGARKVRIVGSVARGKARRGSDVDFLVDMEEGRSLLDHAALILDLEHLLKRSVDVASERGLRPPVRRESLKRCDQPIRDDRGRLQDIVDAIKRIERYVKRGRRAFEEDELVHTWMIHHIQIIGEAASKLTPSFRKSHHDIPWPQIIKMRHVLVHD